MHTMNFMLVLLFITFACVSQSNAFSDQWMEVPLDHFNLFDNRTWKMRYFVNDEFFIKGKPLFIEVGGEWTIDGNSLKAGQLYKLAKQHHGMLIETEHRYYGKSVPFSFPMSMSAFNTENLQYLQIEQALEDLAFFIEHIKASTPGLENSKVVLHGCSYPGMLVTWMRLRFPHIVDVSYASSAPLGVGLEYPEYYEIIRDTYANVSVSCIDDIKAGFNATAELLKTKEGRQVVKDALREWNYVNVDEMNSYRILRAMISVLNIQNDPLRYEEVSCLSLAMDSDDTSAFHRLINLVIMKSNDRARGSDDDKDEGSTESDDGDADDEGKAEDSDEIPEHLRAGIAWMYQTCTEMGTFTILNRDNPKHPFAIDSTVEEAVEDCGDMFDGMVTENVLRTGIERVTRRYGGKKPKVTKVVTVQGTHDPWRDLAVLEDYTPEAPVIVVEGTHCIDVAEKDTDPDDLLQIRKRIRDLISSWLEEATK